MSDFKTIVLAALQEIKTAHESVSVSIQTEREIFANQTITIAKTLLNEYTPNKHKFHKYLEQNGLGDNVIMHQDRSALLNIARFPEQSYNVLLKTQRRSWQHIWRDEIKPNIPDFPTTKENANAAKLRQPRGAARLPQNSHNPEPVPFVPPPLTDPGAVPADIHQQIEKRMKTIMNEFGLLTILVEKHSASMLPLMLRELHQGLNALRLDTNGLMKEIRKYASDVYGPLPACDYIFKEYTAYSERLKKDQLDS